jgi:hypothetical protein
MERQGTYYQPGEYSHCTIGALRVATDMLGMDEKKAYALELATAAMGAHTNAGAEIPRWNDKDERTEEDIHEALRQASKTIANAA